MSFLFFFSRNIGYGCANSISRVGAMVAPQIVQLVRSFNYLMFVFYALELVPL